MQDFNVVVKDTKGSIEIQNFDGIKAALSEQMEVYKALEITEDGKQSAKKDVATLRKIRKAIDDRRKEIKKSFRDPYNDFEAKVKELTGLIDEPIGLITEKLDEFEAKRIEERKSLILQLWNENINVPGAEITTFYNQSWENTSTSKSSIVSDISQINVDYETGKTTISSFTDVDDVEIEKALKLFVATKLNITAAIQDINQYRENKKMIEEQARIRAEREAQRKIEEEKEREEKAQRKIEEAREQARSEAEDQFRREDAARQQDIGDEVQDIMRERQDVEKEESASADEVLFYDDGKETRTFRFRLSFEEYSMLIAALDKLEISYTED